MSPQLSVAANINPPAGIDSEFITRDGCAGTANYRLAGAGSSSSHLHIMWSSPNNFDKHASHLAVGGYNVQFSVCVRHLRMKPPAVMSQPGVGKS